MVRRDATRADAAIEAEVLVARCAFPVGASPIPVSIGAPGSRPQAGRETFLSERGVKSLRGSESC